MPNDGTGPREADRRHDEGPDERLHWRIVLDFGRIALEDMELTSLLQRAVTQLARGTGIRHTKVLQYRPSRGDLLAVAGIGWKPGFIGKARFAVDVTSPPGCCLQTGQPVIIDDLPKHSEFRISKPLADHGIKALANVPITFDGKTWGVLEIDRDKPGPFHEADLDFLQTMAFLLAGALQRVEAQARAHTAAADAAGRSTRGAMLLRELQHRAKNNLQLLIAMLARESHVMKDTMPEAAERIGRVMERVSAVAIAHDRLSPGEDDGEIAGTTTDLGGYLEALCASLELTLGDRLAIETNLERCALSFDRAVATGLIVNELVTNAAKYAYPDEHVGGVVRVELAADRDRAEATLTVSDEGRGIDPAAARRPHRPGGQGLSLVQLLARQLGGEVAYAEPERGTEISVHFPLLV